MDPKCSPHKYWIPKSKVSRCFGFLNHKSNFPDYKESQIKNPNSNSKCALKTRWPWPRQTRLSRKQIRTHIIVGPRLPKLDPQDSFPPKMNVRQWWTVDFCSSGKLNLIILWFSRKFPKIQNAINSQNIPKISRIMYRPYSNFKKYTHAPPYVYKHDMLCEKWS